MKLFRSFGFWLSTLALAVSLSVYGPVVMGQSQCTLDCLEQLARCIKEREGGEMLMVDCEDQYDACLESCVG
jgi:hypothetical protein